MNLSRKRRRELKQLRSVAEDVLHDQRVVLGRAGVVLQEASRQAKALSDEHLAPRVNDALANARPVLDSGVFAARSAANTIRRVSAPIVTGALMSTVRALDAVDDDRARRASSSLLGFGQRAGIVEKPRRRRGGTVFGVIVGVLAALGIGYALWQTFRADDELWIAGDENEFTQA